MKLQSISFVIGALAVSVTDGADAKKSSKKATNAPSVSPYFGPTDQECYESGKEAAANVVAVYTAPYCTVNIFASPKVKLSIEEQCRGAAIESCKVYIPDAYKELLEISECTEIDDELDSITRESLEDECEETVDAFISIFGN